MKKTVGIILILIYTSLAYVQNTKQVFKEGQIVYLETGIIEFNVRQTLQMASSHCKEEGITIVNIPYKWEYSNDMFVYTENAWPPLVPFTVDTAKIKAYLHDPFRISYKTFNVKDFWELQLEWKDGKKAKYRQTQYNDTGEDIEINGKKIGKKDLRSFYVIRVPKEIGDFSTGSLVSISEQYKKRKDVKKIEKLITDQLKKIKPVEDMQ